MVNLIKENNAQHQPSNSYRKDIIKILQKKHGPIAKHLDLINALGFRKSQFFFPIYENNQTRKCIQKTFQKSHHNLMMKICHF